MKIHCTIFLFLILLSRLYSKFPPSLLETLSQTEFGKSLKSIVDVHQNVGSDNEELGKILLSIKDELMKEYRDIMKSLRTSKKCCRSVLSVFEDKIKEYNNKVQTLDQRKSELEQSINQMQEQLQKFKKDEQDYNIKLEGLDGKTKEQEESNKNKQTKISEIIKNINKALVLLQELVAAPQQQMYVHSYISFFSPQYWIQKSDVSKSPAYRIIVNSGSSLSYYDRKMKMKEAFYIILNYLNTEYKGFIRPIIDYLDRAVANYYNQQQIQIGINLLYQFKNHLQSQYDQFSIQKQNLIKEQEQFKQNVNQNLKDLMKQKDQVTSQLKDSIHEQSIILKEQTTYKGNYDFDRESMQYKENECKQTQEKLQKEADDTSNELGILDKLGEHFFSKVLTASDYVKSISTKSISKEKSKTMAVIPVQQYEICSEILDNQEKTLECKCPQGKKSTITKMIFANYGDSPGCLKSQDRMSIGGCSLDILQEIQRCNTQERCQIQCNYAAQVMNQKQCNLQKKFCKVNFQCICE